MIEYIEIKRNRVDVSHRLGNLIAAFFRIIDGLFSILTLGLLDINLITSWNLYRTSKGILVGEEWKNRKSVNNIKK